VFDVYKYDEPIELDVGETGAEHRRDVVVSP